MDTNVIHQIARGKTNRIILGFLIQCLLHWVTRGGLCPNPSVVSRLNAYIRQDRMVPFNDVGGNTVQADNFEYSSIVFGQTSGKIYFFATGKTNSSYSGLKTYTYVSNKTAAIYYLFQSAPKSFSVFPNESFLVCIKLGTPIAIIIFSNPKLSISKSYSNSSLQLTTFYESSIKTTVSKANYIYFSACNPSNCYICQVTQQDSNKISCLTVNGQISTRTFEVIDTYLFVASTLSTGTVNPTQLDIFDFKAQIFMANKQISIQSFQIQTENSDVLYENGIIYTAFITNGQSVLFANFNSTTLELISQVWSRTGTNQCDFVYGINYNIENLNIYYLLSCNSTTKFAELYEYDVSQSKFTNLYRQSATKIITKNAVSTQVYINRCEFITNSLMLCAGGTTSCTSIVPCMASTLVTPYKQIDLLPSFSVLSSADVLFNISTLINLSNVTKTISVSQFSKVKNSSPAAINVQINNYQSLNGSTAYYFGDITLNSVVTSQTNKTSINMTCTNTTTASVSHSLSSYNGGTEPTWLSIDNLASQISTTGPYVTVPTTYTFTLTSTIIDFSTTSKIIRKVTIVVQPCGVNKCIKCPITSQCEECYTGYDMYADNLSCDPIPVPATISSSTYATQGMIGAGMTMSIIGSVINLANPQSIWSMINQFQILILVPMIGTFMSADIYKFMEGMKVTLISLDFIPVISIPCISDLVNEIDFIQSNKYLSKVGVSSGSAFVIHLSTFGTLLLTIIAHLLFMIPYLLTRNPTKVKMFHKIMKAIYNYLTFGLYIRLFLEIFFRYCLVAAKEIYDGNDKSSDKLKISYYISVILLCIWGCFPLFVLLHWLSLCFYQFKVENSKFSELYAEIKQNLIARAYTLIFIIKRIVFICLVTILYSLPLLTKVAIFSCVNVLSYVHLVSCKPFEAVKDNIVEIIMDSFYLFISAFMWVYNTRSSWKDWCTSTMISCILLIYVATTIVNLIVAYFSLKKLICNCVSRIKNLNKNKAITKEVSDINKNKLRPISKNFKQKLYEESKIPNATSDLASNIQLTQDQNLVEIPFRLKPRTLSEFDEVQDEDDIEEVKEERINQNEPFFFDIENEINKNEIIQVYSSQNELEEQKNEWEEQMKQDMNKIKNRIKRKMNGIDINLKTSN